MILCASPSSMRQEVCHIPKYMGLWRPVLQLSTNHSFSLFQTSSSVPLSVGHSAIHSISRRPRPQATLVAPPIQSPVPRDRMLLLLILDHAASLQKPVIVSLLHSHSHHTCTGLQLRLCSIKLTRRNIHICGLVCRCSSMPLVI
jgi:hypothetical protein